MAPRGIPPGAGAVNVSAMKWDNPNNAAMSLQIMAEMVRRGDVTCLKITGSGETATVRLETKPKGKR